MRYPQQHRRCRRAWNAGATALGAVLLLAGGMVGVVGAAPASSDTNVSTLIVGADPSVVAVDPTTGIAYVANSGTGKIVEISGSTVTYDWAGIGSSILGPFALATWLDPATNQHLLVGSYDYPGPDRPAGCQFCVIARDADTGTILWSSKVLNPGSLNALAVDPTTGNVLAATGDGQVFATSAHTGQVLWETTGLPVASEGALAVDPTTGNVYVADASSDTVTVLDEQTGTVTGTVSGVHDPTGMVVDPATGEVYVLNSGSNTVSVISEAKGTVTTTINVGQESTGIAIDPTPGNVYVTNSGSNTVSVISEATATVAATVGVGADPTGIAVDPSTHNVYVTNSGDGTVSVLSGAGAQLSLLETSVTNEVSSVGPATSLSRLLAHAQSFFWASKLRATCGQLNAFTSEVSGLSTRVISTSAATSLLGDAQRIETVLGC